MKANGSYISSSLWGSQKLDTAKNTAISSNFLVWQFYVRAQFSQRFGRIAQNCTETVPFHKIATQGN